ncbi:hypothetical protein ACW9HR_08575 [Nocardia gipuzkoensis]
MQLVIPPEFVDKLAPRDPGFFTQPVATMVAALVALTAAALAWWGVQRQIKASAANVRVQLEAQAAQFKLAQEAQAAKETRAERLAVVREVLEAASAVYTAMGEVHASAKGVAAGKPLSSVFLPTQKLLTTSLTLGTSVQLMVALGVEDVWPAWKELHSAMSEYLGVVKTLDDLEEDETPPFDERRIAWLQKHRKLISTVSKVLEPAG